ncbi:hypothetical protein Zmor_015828 [Zophobas morio]|uniref:C2H2-type domain-containing protein n=1 Tax=Zophobas morio TaxID=2755281 RepID=A0AA38MGY3_9CUCU|nr:hypothetical protein Zmor_015828 [Zophobas morio]
MSLLKYSKKLVQMKPSLNNVHHCKVCPYFTTSLLLMVNHVKRHQAPPQYFNCENIDIETYHCEDCNFQTELTLLFKQHAQLCYRKSEENLPEQVYSSQSFICKKCSFETHFKLKWLQHSTQCLGSNNFQIVTPNGKITIWYYCNQCEGRFTRKQNLKAHKILKHLSDDQRRWYYCGHCSYKSILKSRLKVHVMRHMNKPKSRISLKTPGVMEYVDEQGIKWYKCEKYPHKTKIKGNLIKHINYLRFDEKDITWHKCQTCSYKDKNLLALKRHIMVHHLKNKDVTWHKCQSCQYMTKYHRVLKEHINGHHLDEQDIKWHECEECSYKTKYKSNLSSHKLVSHPSEDWSQYTPRMVKKLPSKPLHVSKKGKIRVGANLTNYKWCQLADEKRNNSVFKKKLLEEDHKQKQEIHAIMKNHLQEEHEQKLRHREEEHYVKLKLMQEEHALRMTLLKQQITFSDVDNN